MFTVEQFSNLLNYTVMALGNHDFDDGTAGLQPFVDQVISNGLTL